MGTSARLGPEKMRDVNVDTRGGGLVVGSGAAAGAGGSVIISSPEATGSGGSGNITVTPADSSSVIRALSDLRCALIDAQVKQAAQFMGEIASLEQSLITRGHAPRDTTKSMFDTIKSVAGAVGPVMDAVSRVMGLLGL